MSTDDEPHEVSEELPDVLPFFADEADEDDVLCGDDLERAYQQAMSAIDDIEQDLPGAAMNSADASEPSPAPPSSDVSEAAEIAPVEGSVSALPPLPRLHPSQIIEAALFVGGMPLTVKKLANVLRDEFDRDFIERTIDDLNLQYDDENRPYEILLEEGGYRMVLRSEFETVRNKSFGFGPKEVRLSQDVLEVLALVAYRQPISREQIEQAGKSKPNGALRQLLRREIISLERTGKTAKDVCYRTTSRFLQVFGLADLNELPRGEDLAFK